MRKLLCISAIVLMVAGSSCSKKAPENPASTAVPVVTTGVVTNISSTDASFSGNVSAGFDGNYQSGFYYSQNPNPNQNDQAVFSYSATSDLHGATSSVLTPGTTYHVRAFSANANGIGLGNDVTFTTAVEYTLTTNAVTDIQTDKASFNAQLSLASNAQPGTVGFVYGTSPTPTLNNNSYWFGSNGTGTISNQVTNLQPATTYYVRAVFERNGTLLGYGAETTFKTTGYLGMSGGTVVYDKGVSSNGWRYLEAGPADLNYNSSNTGALWGCSGTQLLLTTTALGDGATNTTRIIGQCNAANCAARLCDNYIIGGFSDWYLPSRDEMTMMYDALGTTFLSGSAYWTSSEISASSAYYVYLNPNGQFGSSSKSQYWGVRPMRRF